jgi:hypothetical protein
MISDGTINRIQVLGQITTLSNCQISDMLCHLLTHQREGGKLFIAHSGYYPPLFLLVEEEFFPVWILPATVSASRRGKGSCSFPILDTTRHCVC